MKRVKQFIYTLFVCFLSVGFCACDKNENDEPGGEILNPGSDTIGQWVENGNQLIYTEDYGYYKAQWTLTFNGDICVKSECAYTFPTVEMAEAFFTAWDDLECPARRSGKTVTVDYTALHAGLSKEALKTVIGATGDL